MALPGITVSDAAGEIDAVGVQVTEGQSVVDCVSVISTVIDKTGPGVAELKGIVVGDGLNTGVGDTGHVFVNEGRGEGMASSVGVGVSVPVVSVGSIGVSLTVSEGDIEMLGVNEGIGSCVGDAF